MTVKELYESIGGSYEDALRTLMMDRMIERFIVKLLDDTSCERLLAAYAAGDGAGIFEGAHAMKGVCGNLGLTGLSRQASAVADEFRPGNARSMSDEELERAIAEIRAAYERSIEGIRRFAAER